MSKAHPLYNIRRGPHGFQLGKFDRDLNLLAVYDTDAKHCTCPAGPRPTCKHRKMLPRMLGRVDTSFFYCYETQQWLQPLAEMEAEYCGKVVSEASIDKAEAEPPIESLTTEQVIQGVVASFDLLPSNKDIVATLSRPTPEPTIATHIDLPPDADVAEEFAKLLQPNHLATELPSPTPQAHPTTGGIRRR